MSDTFSLIFWASR